MKTSYTIIAIFLLGLSQPYAYAEPAQETSKAETISVSESVSPENTPKKKKRFDGTDIEWAAPGVGLIYASLRIIHSAIDQINKEHGANKNISLFIKNRTFLLGVSFWVAGKYCLYKSQTPEYWQEWGKASKTITKKALGTIAGGVGLTAGGVMFASAIRTLNAPKIFCALGLYTMLGGYHILEKTWQSNPSIAIKE